MNFNEEMEIVFKEAGLNDGELISIQKEDKGTPSDYANLKAKILIKTEENRNMMVLSDLYSKESLPCGSNTKSLEKNIESQNIEGKTLADISAELRAYLTGSNYSVEQLRRIYTKTYISDIFCMDNPSNCDTGSNYKADSKTLKKIKCRKNPSLGFWKKY